MKNDEKIDKAERTICESISEDKYFWNELHILVEDGVEASREDSNTKKQTT
ncbi:hypothetical protein ACOI1C_15785 [Bacillus sp. DJP31]|uniref:hypothetical protein n=1 Tax=Bacillus sp. DJP31 TaxID=3409789 RepID=UPI003BB4EB66